MEYKQLRQALADELIELGKKHDNVVVMDCDVGRSTRASDFGDAFPDRFINCGIQEANMMDVAAGFSLEGYIPFATGFGVFSTARVMDQIRNTIAYPKLNVKITPTHCGITVGEDGASHQSIEDIALMRALPNMTVIVPGDYNETRQAIRSAAKLNGPVYIRMGRDKYPVIDQFAEEFEIGKAKTLLTGEDVTIVTTGIMINEGLEAVEILKQKGFEVGLIHMPTVKPLDEEAILAAAKNTKVIVTAEEHSVIGGLGEAVASFLSQNHPTEVKMIGVKDSFGTSGKADELMDYFSLRASNIADMAIESLGKY